MRFLANTPTVTIEVCKQGDLLITVSETQSGQLVEATSTIKLDEGCEIALNMVAWLKRMDLDWRFCH
jgi:hypothetical protein